jgi:hypothetical protein
MQRTKSVLLSPLLFALVSAAPAHAQAWIEYTVTGAVSLENREEDVVMCSLTDEAFLVHTLGEWTVSIETDNSSPGEHPATFMVAAPDSIAALNDFRVDDRPKGEGTVGIEDGGTGQLGLPRVVVTFEAADLTSDAGKTIGITGRLVCDVM